MKMPTRTSGFHISDILELNDPKPTSEEPDIPGESHFDNNSLCPLPVSYNVLIYRRLRVNPQMSFLVTERFYYNYYSPILICP